MAGIPFTVTSGIQATGGTTGPKSLISLLAATYGRCEVDEIGVGYFGTNSAATPVLTEILQQTSAGTGGTTAAAAKQNPLDLGTLDVYGLVCAVTTGNWTGEPTPGDVYRALPIHPQTSQIFHFPEPLVIPGTGTGRLGVRATADASVNCVVTVKGRRCGG